MQLCVGLKLKEMHFQASEEVSLRDFFPSRKLQSTFRNDIQLGGCLIPKAHKINNKSYNRTI